LNRLRLPSGVAIRAEDGAARCATSGKPSDKAGARRSQTRRGGRRQPTANEFPQPQEEVALGFRTTKEAPVISST
jgi:hypothetical protein